MFQGKCSLLLAVVFTAFLAKSQTNNLLKVETYTLDNGLKVFLNEDSTATRVFGAVLVNAGAKHEDPEATGMAHYLEHMLFKGTDVLGTWDYAKEKQHLDSINFLYGELAKAATPEAKSDLQKKINEQAVKAAAYGLPNEFDRLLKSIGSTEINAFTTYDMTFYHNSFPGHEIYKWLDIYATRFQNPVFRSFQSELEVVYEEKNRAIDDFQRRVFEKMESMLFPNLPYGQWSVLGTTEHLKTPSLTKMYAFYDKYYVPNNMALVLTGNFDAEKVLPVIQEKFGAWKRREVPELTLGKLKPFKGEKVEKVRMTPIKAGFLGFQTAPRNHPDREALDVCEYLLYNEGKTGFINQIELNNEMIYVGSFSSIYNDAGGYVIFFVPKILIQSVANAEKKIQHALDQVRNGQFSDELLQAAKNEVNRNFQLHLEDLTQRGILIGGACNAGFTWEQALDYQERIEAVDREDILRVANQYLGDNRVKMISRTGFGKKTRLKKPPYEPVVTDQKKRSEYAEAFDNIPTLPFEPKFLDFEKDIDRDTLPGGHVILTSENPINDLFTLEIRFRIGTITDPKVEYAAKIANYSGAGTYSASALKEAFASLGCSYSVSANPNYLVVKLSGNESHLKQTLQLTNTLLTDLKADDNAKAVLENNEKTSRRIEKRSPGNLGSALLNYASFGKDSYYLRRYSEREVKQTDPSDLKDLFHQITGGYQAEIVFNGDLSASALAHLLTQEVTLTKEPQAEPYQYRDIKGLEKPLILFVNDKKAVQSHVYFNLPTKPVGKDEYTQVQAFNEYFGGGFSGLVLQEIREYRSLAYSSGAWFVVPPLAGEETRLVTYIGCQADKTTEAIQVMQGLISDMPEKAERIGSLRQTLKMKINTDYPDTKSIADQIMDLERRGYDRDPNLMAYKSYDTLKMEDISSFYESYIKGRPYTITIYGDKKRINLEALEEIGEVRKVKLKDFITM